MNKIIQKNGKDYLRISENVWKIYWKRANLKLSSYKPNPTVNLLSDFLKIVDENEHACFKG